MRRLDYGEERFGFPEGVAPSRPRRLAISPWLFVLATALNTMVAAVVAVFITLGVAKQERTNNSQQGEIAPASANTRPTVAVVSEPAPSIIAPQPIGLLPIGSPNQPLRPSRHDLVRSDADRFRHMVLAPRLVEPPRDHFARMVDIGV